MGLGVWVLGFSRGRGVSDGAAMAVPAAVLLPNPVMEGFFCRLLRTEEP